MLLLPYALASFAWSSDRTVGHFADVQDVYSRAKKADGATSWSTAVSKLRDFLEFKTGTPSETSVATFWLAESLFQLRHYDQAQQFYTAFLKEHVAHNPNLESLGLLRLGHIAYVKQDFAEAREALAEFHTRLADDTYASYALFYLAETSMALGDGAAAQVHFAKAATVASDARLRDECRLGVARAIELNGDQQLALDAFEHLAAEQSSTVSGRALYRAARLHFQFDNFAQTLAQIDSLLQRQPDTELAQQASSLAGDAHVKLGQHAEAAKAYANSVMATRPDALKPLVVSRTAEAFRLAGDSRRAAEYYSLIRSRWPDSVWAGHGLLGQMRLAYEDQDDALVERLQTQLERAELDQKGQLEADHIFATSLLRRQEFDRVVELLRAPTDSEEASDERYALLSRALMKLERYHEAIAPLDALVASTADGKSVQTYRSDLVIALTETGNLDRAKRVYDQLTRDNSEADLSSLLETTAYLASRAVESGDHEFAARLYQTLSQQDSSPQYAAKGVEGLAQVAKIFAEASRTDEAAQRLDQLLSTQLDSTLRAQCLFLRGKIAAQTADWNSVIRTMQLLEREASDEQTRNIAKYWIAEALYRDGQYPEALTHLHRLQDLATDRQESWLGMIPLRQAQSLAHLDRWQEAHEIAERIPSQYPNFRQQYEADYLIGRFQARQGRFREAREAYERVIRSADGANTETAAMAQWMIGETYFHQRKYEEAIPAYLSTETLYQHPRWQAGGLLQAGKCYEMQNDLKAAIELYTRLLNRYPQTMFRDEARHRLNLARSRLLNNRQTS